MTDWPVDDKRLIDIESKIAHQEDLLVQLNTALSDQQVQLSRLEAICETIVDRLRSMSDGAAAGDPADERPPHY